MKLDNLDKYKLSDKQHNEILDELKASVFHGALSVKNPSAVITGGQPASGKGNLARMGKDSFASKGGAVVIDPDELRSEHPAYEKLQQTNDKESAAYTHHDAKKWSVELIDEAIKQKKNIVIDQTSANFDDVKATVEKLRKNGYEHIELKMMAVPELHSKQGIHDRYETQKGKLGSGRFVPMDVHDYIYERLPNTVKEVERTQLVDKLSVYDKNYKQIDSKEFDIERNRAYSDKEKVQHDYKWFSVIEKMETRNAPITAIEDIKRLQQEDRVKLQIPPDRNYYAISAEDHKKLSEQQNHITKQAPNDKAKKLIENEFTHRVYQLAAEGNLKRTLDKMVQSPAPAKTVKQAEPAKPETPKQPTKNKEPDR